MFDLLLKVFETTLKSVTMISYNSHKKSSFYLSNHYLIICFYYFNEIFSCGDRYFASFKIFLELFYHSQLLLGHETYSYLAMEFEEGFHLQILIFSNLHFER